MTRKETLQTYLLLHCILLIYSIAGVLSKLASKEVFLSLNFFILYGFAMVLLAIYAIGWQQVIKKMALTSAFANKSTTVLWGIVWGNLIFSEQITIGKILGAGIIVSGVISYSLSSRSENE